MQQTNYPKDSAGKIMVAKENLPVFLKTKKISEIKKEFQTRIEFYEVCYYIYFIDKDEKLVGVLSERELFSTRLDIEAQEIMNKKIIKVHHNIDQERVAIFAINHHLKTIPVVDKDNKFLGAIPDRAIFNILHHEHVEDFLKTAGIHSLPAQTLVAPASFLLKVRVPWLIIGLFGGLLAAKLTDFFEAPLKEYFILAAFIPLIVYMADAIGTQTQTLFIRNLVLRELKLKKYLLKETRVGLGISLILGMLLSVISFIWSRKIVISMILGISMFFTGMAAIFIPILTVYLLCRLKKDPAIGSGPFATIIQDITSLAIYFLVASLLLKIFT